jgi:serine protease Do
MSWLEETKAAVAAVADAVGPSVVGVGQRWAVGSGVVVEPGAVLTNAHNVRGGEVDITFSDGRRSSGRAAGMDVDGDIAVISTDTGSARAIAWPETPAALDLGTPVFALANPGGRGLRVTVGLVSGTERSFRGPRGRRITGSVEHTSPLLPGSSGGPIVDSDGTLLGLNTNRLGEGFYLAIPADADLRERVSRLVAGESPARPRLGVGVAPPRVATGLRRAVGLPEVDGLLVRAVEDASPAARAGLAEGDLIVEADGRATESADALHAALDGAEAGEGLRLKVLRGTEERSVVVTWSDGGGDG